MPRILKSYFSISFPQFTSRNLRAYFSKCLVCVCFTFVSEKTWEGNIFVISTYRPMCSTVAHKPVFPLVCVFVCICISVCFCVCHRCWTLREQRCPRVTTSRQLQATVATQSATATPSPPARLQESLYGCLGNSCPWWGWGWGGRWWRVFWMYSSNTCPTSICGE